jgi:hypothetical protein
MDYCAGMKEKRFHKVGKTGFMLWAAFLVTLNGCVRDVDRPRADHVYVLPPAQLEPVYAGQDDYVYYPRYQMYYGNHSQRYFYQQGHSWVSRPEPQGISVRVLQSSPSVPVGFHDAPAAHHDQIIRTYPKGWAPPGANQGRPGGQKENPRKN